MPDPEGDSLAMVFKTKVHEFLGQLSLIKVMSGTITADDVLGNSRTRDSLRMHQLLAPMGGHYTSIREIVAEVEARIARFEGGSG